MVICEKQILKPENKGNIVPQIIWATLKIFQLKTHFLLDNLWKLDPFFGLGKSQHRSDQLLKFQNILADVYLTGQ